MLREVFPVSFLLKVDVGQLWFQQAQEVAERFVLAAVGGGASQDQVPRRIGGEVADQLVALIAA